MHSKFLQRTVSRQTLGVVVITALALLWAAPAPAEVIWQGDFETGTTEQWKGAPKFDGVKLVTEPVREGKYALRIDGTNAAKRGANDRIEFQHQPKPPGTAEGTERYFGWSIYLPRKFTDTSHTVGYFETRNSWSRLLAFEARGEDIKFSTRVPYRLHWTGKGKLTPGRWHDFVVHVLWSRDPAKGFIEVWFDGEKVVPLTKTATLLDENVAFFQIGLFRETSETPETIIFDHVVEATTLEEVIPSATPKSCDCRVPASSLQRCRDADGFETGHRHQVGGIDDLRFVPLPAAGGENEWLQFAVAIVEQSALPLPRLRHLALVERGQMQGHRLPDMVLRAIQIHGHNAGFAAGQAA